MKRGLLIGIGAVVVVAGVLTIPVEAEPSPDTRVILEHTNKRYISPPVMSKPAKRTI